MIDDIARPERTKAPWPVITTDNFEDNTAEGPRVKVRCIDPRGIFYDYLRRRQGDVFELRPQYVTLIDENTGKPVMEGGKVKKRLITAEEQFSENTMERVEANVPNVITSAQAALNREQENLYAEKAAPARGRKSA